MSDVGGVVSHSGNWTPAGGTPSAGGVNANHNPNQISSVGMTGNIEADVLAHYPSYAWALQIPELRTILTPLLEGTGVEVSPQEVQSKIEASTWWRTQSQTFRDWNVLIAMDPTTAQSKVDQKYAEISSLANRMGVVMDHDRTLALAQQANAFGWDSNQLQQTVSAYFQYSNHLQGQAALTKFQLQQMAQKYFIQPSDAILQKWVQDVIAGKADPAAFQAELVNEAKSRWANNAQITDALDRGVDMTAITDPYKNLAAQTLEVNPAAVDWTDPKWGKFLDAVDPKTGIHSMMTLADAKSEMMSNPAYGYDNTSGARTQAADLATKLSQAMGAV